MRRFLFLLAIFFVSSFCVFPQEEAAETAPAAAEEQVQTTDSDGAVLETAPEGAVSAEAQTEPAGETVEEKDPEKEILEMDIRTSTLMELASWCRTLGLSEGGTKDELANRLRSHFTLPRAGGTVSEEAKIITIESARTTEYFTLDVVDEEYARLRGGVVISLKDDDAVHRIKAREILYNRTRNVMTASGGVEYVKDDGDTVETFRGESITVNLDNWSSIFMDGVSERSASENETTYRFAGTVISRNSEEVTVLTRAEVSNANNEDALWSLNASKLWLLPGSDWAIFNAILKVGNIPVLWLPFFFYPSDEIIFHPVLGYRTREGTFAQTTTYILGRPKTSGTSENSMTKIFGGAGDTEKVREGVFLRSTGKKRRATDETRLSVIFDAYANLGAYLGTELSIPRKGIMGAFDLSFGLGFTRNIYPMGNTNTPFLLYDGTSDWHSSYLFSAELPLRYRLETKSSLSGTYGSLSWSLPFYSDPYVNRDFMNRSEELDWLSMLREGATTETDESTDVHISTYDWTLNGSLSPKVSALNPYITSLSISNISSSLNFTNRDAPNYTGPATFPNADKKFFLPNKFNILSLTASVTGNPFSFGAETSSSSTGSGAQQQQEPAPGDALLPALPRQPWEEPESKTASAAATTDNFTLAPPVLSQRFTGARSISPKLSFDYRFAPTFGSELQFRTSPDNWVESGDIDWSEISSVLSRISTNASMGLALSHPDGGAYSGSFRINGSGNWQDYSYINEGAEEYTRTVTVTNPDDGSRTTVTETDPARMKAALDRAYSQTNVNTTYEFSTAFKPFYRSPVWGATSIGYSFSGLLAKTEYDGSGVTGIENDPNWDWVLGEWNKTDLSTNQANLNISANIMDYVQTLSITNVLPPKETSLAANAVMRAWITETGASTSITEPYDDEKRIFRPINLTETLKFGTLHNFQQLVIYDPELEEYTSLKSTLNLDGFSASYVMTHMAPYFLNHNGSVDPSRNPGWIQIAEDDKSLIPQTLSFSYGKSFNKTDLLNKRLSLSFRVNTGLSFDLQRYTYSSFNFDLTMTAGLTNFLDLSLSASSSNSQIYRYFQDLPFFTADVPIPPGLETNFFKDLFNSFRFDDMNLRRNSGFKLKTLSMNLIHHLGDWNAKLGITLAPYLDNTGQGIPTYKFNTQISFLVQWVPIEEIRLESIYEKDELTFK